MSKCGQGEGGGGWTPGPIFWPLKFLFDSQKKWNPTILFNIKRSPSEMNFLLEPLQKNVFGSPKNN